MIPFDGGIDQPVSLLERSHTRGEVDDVETVLGNAATIGSHLGLQQVDGRAVGLDGDLGILNGQLVGRDICRILVERGFQSGKVLLKGADFTTICGDGFGVDLGDLGKRVLSLLALRLTIGLRKFQTGYLLLKRAYQVCILSYLLIPNGIAFIIFTRNESARGYREHGNSKQIIGNPFFH